MNAIELYAAEATLEYAKKIEALVLAAIEISFTANCDIPPIVVPNAMRPGSTVYFQDIDQQRIYL
jgi:hypothetical protein